MTKVVVPNSAYTRFMTVEEFILGMLTLGTPIEMSLVGAFEPADTKGRGSLRDMDLALHQDGVYSAKLATEQGGHYVERPGIKYVGLYCVRGGKEPCYTTVGDLQGNEISSIDLKKGEALILDNKAVTHGRRGPVGDRILIRLWIGEPK